MWRWCRTILSPRPRHSSPLIQYSSHHAHALRRRSTDSPVICALYAFPVTSSRRRVSSNDTRSHSLAPECSSPDAPHSYDVRNLDDIFPRSSHPSQVFSLAELDSLYESAKRTGQLELFSAAQLSSLISVFGSLSLGSNRVHDKYHTPLLPPAARIAADPTRWSQVAYLVQLKEELGFELNAMDQYWMLRSTLFKLATDCRESVSSSSGSTIRKLLAEARFRYESIFQTIPEAEVHLLYFTTVLRWPSPARVADVIHHLCFVFDRDDFPPRQFSDLLWDVILRDGRFITPSLKHCVLEMLSSRLVRSPDVVRSPAGVSVPVHGAAPNHANVTASNDIAALFAGCFFPSYRPPSIDSATQQWALRVSERVCKDSWPVDVRWNNFILLAASIRANLPTLAGVTTPAPEEEFLSWRTILILSTLDNVLRSTHDDGVTSSGSLQAILRPLWRAWKRGAAHVDAVSVLRTVTTSFLQLAGETSDGPLTTGCFNFCNEKSLFVDGMHRKGALECPVQELVATYVVAATRCRTPWPDIFSALDAAGIPRNNHVLEATLRRLISDNPLQAYGLCIFALENGLSPSFRSLTDLIKVLVSGRKWVKASRLLALSRFKRLDAQELILTILEEFRAQRTTRIHSEFAKLISGKLQTLYEGSAPPVHTKWQIRFFLPIAIMSQQPKMALDIVEMIHKTAPSFFTVRYLLRLLRVFLLHGQFEFATRLFQTARRTPGTSSAIDDFRRKLSLGLAVGGAHGLSRKAYQMRDRSRRVSTRERTLKAVQFKYRYPKRSATYNLLKRVGTDLLKPDASNIRHVISLLLKTKRYSLARKLFGQACRHLDYKYTTILGNMILHAPMHKLDHRNRRLIRFVVRSKDFLVNNYGFKPDRTTVNIIVKSVLKWRQLDSSQLKALFDYMSKQGYLPSMRSKQQVDVPPAKSALALAKLLSLPTLPPGISFHKHARPLFKMFIKAFHCRGDHDAAREVVNIMKTEARFAQREWEKREQARRKGFLKKKPTA